MRTFETSLIHRRWPTLDLDELLLIPSTVIVRKILKRTVNLRDNTHAMRLVRVQQGTRQKASGGPEVQLADDLSVLFRNTRNTHSNNEVDAFCLVEWSSIQVKGDRRSLHMVHFVLKMNDNP